MIPIIGRIYGIYDTNEKCLYIGSTSRSLAERLSCHKSCSKELPSRAVYKYVLENGGWDQFQMRLIEDVVCDSIKTLQRREGEVIMKMAPLCNQRIAGRSKAEYRQANIEKYREYMRQYMKQYNRKKKERREELENI